MEDKTQKERLEQELRFLKESFEAEVISKEEYEKGIGRIEGKLKEIKDSAGSAEKGLTAEEKTEEPKREDAIESREGDKIKLRVIPDESGEQDYFEPSKETGQKEQSKAPPTQEPKKKSRFLRYAVIFAVLALVVFFSYSLSTKKDTQERAPQLKFAAACISDDDCRQEGKEGACISPGTKSAKCEFKEIPKTNVIVLNDRNNCFNCDTKRVLSILENWFGAVNAKEIAYSTGEGENIADKFGAGILPVYILDENITKKPKFADLKQIFINKDNHYILSEDASGSSFYFKRDNVQNKIDLFVIFGDDAGIKAEKNLKEFLDAFPEAEFDRHDSDDALAKELGIKTFPTFLINNRIKFSGVVAAETIKNNFCKPNKLAACGKSLPKSLA